MNDNARDANACCGRETHKGAITGTCRETSSVEALVAEIIDDVDRCGNKAVREYSAKFNKVVPQRFEVTGAERQAVLDATEVRKRRVTVCF